MVKSATRVLDLLEVLSAPGAPRRVKDIAAQLAIPQSSASMLIATLEERRYVERDADGSCRIARRFANGGWIGGDLGVLLRVAAGPMHTLAERTGESAFMGVLTPLREMQYVHKAVSASALRYDADMGFARPAYATTTGLVLLAGLPDAERDSYLAAVRLMALTPTTIVDREVLRDTLATVRKRGYAELTDSHVVGASGMAFPVRDTGGAVIAALSVIAPSARFLPIAERVRAALGDTCIQIQAALANPR